MKRSCRQPGAGDDTQGAEAGEAQAGVKTESAKGPRSEAVTVWTDNPGVRRPDQLADAEAVDVMGKKSMRKLGRRMAAGIERSLPLRKALQQKAKANAQRGAPDPTATGLRNGWPLPPSMGGRIRYRPGEKPTT